MSKTSKKTTHPWPPRGRSRRRWMGMAVVGLALVAALALLAVGARRPAGALAAQHDLHDFGQVAIDGGLLEARFPLEIEGTVVVTGLGTT